MGSLPCAGSLFLSRMETVDETIYKGSVDKIRVFRWFFTDGRVNITAFRADLEFPSQAVSAKRCGIVFAEHLSRFEMGN